MPVKMTVELRETLLKAALEAAAADGTSLRALIEEGLELALERRQQQSFPLRKASYGGRGVRVGIREGDWSTVRPPIYAGRGD